MRHEHALAYFYELGLDDRDEGLYLPPAGDDSEPLVRAYQDGWDAADRLRHVTPEDIIGCSVEGCEHFDRATGEGRR
jgi:hypothetical protein